MKLPMMAKVSQAIHQQALQDVEGVFRQELEQAGVRRVNLEQAPVFKPESRKVDFASDLDG